VRYHNGASSVDSDTPLLTRDSRIREARRARLLTVGRTPADLTRAMPKAKGAGAIPASLHFNRR
jgi:hypothetical protein